jgi:hypothetical protein
MRGHRRLSILLAAALAPLATAALAAGAERHGSHATAGAGMGEVRFPISCSETAQKSFGQAVWILHSFWYDEAVRSFGAITEAEPDCAMGYWGIAMSHWYPLWFPPNAAALKAGSAAVGKAVEAQAKTDRERDYIAAIAAFYRDSDKLDHRTRSVAYEKAMEQVYLRYPDDPEAGIFYALALNATALPTDKTYANQRKAAAILEKAHGEQPNHPGVAHYLIHSYDSATLAELGLPAARSYGEIAPAVPHAQHMPSHIFTRLGLWQESIASNLAAHEAALAHAAKTLGPGSWDQETVHTMDYLEYAYLQGAQDRAAKRVLDELMAFEKGPAGLPIAYAMAAIPARYALERRDWAEAAALTAPAVSFPWERFPWAAAMTSFARALGAARTGDKAGAEAELATLRSLEGKLVETKDAYWANQVKVQRLGATAVVARVEGKDGEAIELASAAAELEASMDKHPATPGAILPARELLADLLLELGDPGAALKAYEQSLVTDPNRFRSLVGKARAAKLSGDRATANAAYRQLVTVCGNADTPRQELAEARSFLAD